MASQQQPPARTWFRLPTMARPPSQPTPTPEPPAPQPRLPVIRPAFRPVAPTQRQEIGQQPPRPATNGVSSIPTSPVRRTSVPTSPVRRTSVPTSPTTTTTTSPPRPQFTAPYTASVTTSPTITARETATRRVPSPPSPPSPTQFPRTIRPSARTPEQSPKQKPTAPPPSPLSLPPPQLRSRPEHEPKIPTEAEPKGVLVQTIEKPRPWILGAEPRRDFEETHHRPGVANHRGKHEVPKDGETKKKTHHKKFSSDSEEVGMRIITIAGENKGAFMEVIKSPMNGKPRTLLNNGKTKTESDDKTGWHSFSTSTSSGEEGKPKMKDRSHNGKAMVSPQMGAFMNSNVQGVNNSIVYNSSCTHHDPGVHLAFSRKPSGHGFHVKDNGQGHQR